MFRTNTEFIYGGQDSCSEKYTLICWDSVVCYNRKPDILSTSLGFPIFLFHLPIALNHAILVLVFLYHFLGQCIFQLL